MHWNPTHALKEIFVFSYFITVWFASLPHICLNEAEDVASLHSKSNLLLLWHGGSCRWKGSSSSARLTTCPKRTWKSLIWKVWHFIPKQILEIICRIKLSKCTQSGELTLSEMAIITEIATKLLRHFLLYSLHLFLQGAIRLFWLFWWPLFFVIPLGMYWCTALASENSFWKRIPQTALEADKYFLKEKKGDFY